MGPSSYANHVKEHETENDNKDEAVKASLKATPERYTIFYREKYHCPICCIGFESSDAVWDHLQDQHSHKDLMLMGLCYGIKGHEAHNRTYIEFITTEKFKTPPASSILRGV